MTDEERYLKLSQYFLDERGKQPHYFEIEAQKRGQTEIFQGFHKLDYSYSQAHRPVRQQTTVEGHAVRAMYMCVAMADVAGETGDVELFEACRRLWENATTRRMYITGGIGSTSICEAFTFDYDLPNDTVYAETCASIGLIFFAHRMLKIDENRRYADVMERALYNTVLSGISLDGTRYFYVNPLDVWPEASEKNPTRKHVKPVRPKWYACACCPPNLARLLMSLGQYIYTIRKQTIYTHLYISGNTRLELDGVPITIMQATNYPWESNIKISFSMEQEMHLTLALRIPGWCREACLTVNGEPVELASDSIVNGYAIITRGWHPDDQVELEFAMPVEIMQAHPEVRENAGKVAIMRGPVVFCLEEVDNGSNLSTIALPYNAQLMATFDKDLFGGTMVITGEGYRQNEGDWDDTLYRPVEHSLKPVTIKAIPYSLWSNRTPGEMLVWTRAI